MARTSIEQKAIEKAESSSEEEIKIGKIKLLQSKIEKFELPKTENHFDRGGSIARIHFKVKKEF